MVRKTYIIHFHPLSYYPPAENLIYFLLEKKEKLKVATVKIQNPIPSDRLDNIVSYVFTKKRTGGFWNLAKQIYFNIYTLISIIIYKPSHIIYYETISALPAIFYKRYFNRKVKIICHYHELNSKSNLKSESRSVRFIRKIEVKNYKNFEWISQTNEFRKSIFIDDYKEHLNIEKIYTLPNYPPKKWITPFKDNFDKQVTKFVLIGSINVEKMYLKEFCGLLEKQKSNFKFDIYSFELDTKTKDFIDSKSYIKHKGPISYDEIPSILNYYDVGVILYKPLSINITGCASNKLFEYHTCGLDVLFPTNMTFTRNYITQNTYPIIQEIDFENTEKIDISSLLNKKNLEKRVFTYTAEDEFEKLYKFMIRPANTAPIS